MNVHSYGGFFMWPPGAYKFDGRITLPRPSIEESAQFLDAAKQIVSAIAAHRGTVTWPGFTGPVADVLYSAAGNSADELYYEQGIFAWDFEVGNLMFNQATQEWERPGFQPPYAEAHEEAMEYAGGLVQLVRVAQQYQNSHADGGHRTLTPHTAPRRLPRRGVVFDTGNAVAGFCRPGQHGGMASFQHRADLFIDPDEDPRSGGPTLGDERATLTEFLRFQRLTLQLKCEGLDAEQLARRSVEPSTMSLLGLLRHMAEVERGWFRRRFAGNDVPRRYQSEADPDGDFDGAVADPAVVDEAWAAWRDEVAFAEQFTRETELDFVGMDGAGSPISLRELLVHMVEEYARHNGHADLLRERIDGRLGQ